MHRLLLIGLLTLGTCHSAEHEATRRIQPDSGTAAQLVRSPAADTLPTGAAGASHVLEEYFRAIESRDFRLAYHQWENAGSASGQSLAAFAHSFVHTAHVHTQLGTPGRTEGAAGSRYIEIPVVLEALTEEGVRQRFEGIYVLRRTVVAGATPAQRRWHIYSADMRQTESLRVTCPASLTETLAPTIAVRYRAKGRRCGAFRSDPAPLTRESCLWLLSTCSA